MATIIKTIVIIGGIVVKFPFLHMGGDRLKITLFIQRRQNNLTIVYFVLLFVTGNRLVAFESFLAENGSNGIRCKKIFIIWVR